MNAEAAQHFYLKHCFQLQMSLKAVWEDHSMTEACLTQSFRKFQ